MSNQIHVISFHYNISGHVRMVSPSGEWEKHYWKDNTE